LLKIGLGELNLSPPDFYELTFEEFWAMLEGRRHIENLRLRDAWERMRQMAYHIAAYSGNMKKGMTSIKFMPFSWDAPTAVSRIAQLTGEERKEAARRLIEERQKQLETFLNKSKN
jgi:hypothetical protein